jgi:membrane-bound lytic murein transglycosylase D
MRVNLKLKRISAILLVSGAIFFGYNKWLFSWGLFDLFSDKAFTEEGLEKVTEFNPETDILYLPGLEGKDIFQASKDLSITRKKEIRKFIYLYLTTGRDYVKASIYRSYDYMDIIEEIFKEYPDIPSEIALLPLLESGFNPMAVSRSNAIGLWQFLSNTSVYFGLKSDKWVEERRDIDKSTRAALEHLRHLYNSFGSWDLALAAYNGGGGQVRRAMEKTGAKDIWELRKAGVLTKETGEYVPRYLALLIIYNNQKLFGLDKEIASPEKEKTIPVKLKYAVNIHEVSRHLEVPIETIKKYNPELNRKITPVTVEEYSLRLPAKAAKEFEKKSHLLYKKHIKKIKQYTVKKGDTVSGIALNFKSRTALIIKFNDLKKPYIIRPGQTLYIPQ